MLKGRLPEPGESTDEEDLSDVDDSEELSEGEPSANDQDDDRAYKLGEDMNYSMVLEEYRNKQVQQQPPNSKTKPVQKKNTKKKHTQKRTRSVRESDSESEEESGEPPAKIVAIEKNMDAARSFEIERIKQNLAARQKQQQEQRQYIEELAFQGLVGVGQVFDQVCGYDGGFGEHIKNHEGIRELMCHTLAYECSDTKKTVEQYGKMGFLAILGLEYLSYRSINLTMMFSPPPPPPPPAPPAPVLNRGITRDMSQPQHIEPGLHPRAGSRPQNQTPQNPGNTV